MSRKAIRKCLVDDLGLEVCARISVALALAGALSVHIAKGLVVLGAGLDGTLGTSLLRNRRPSASRLAAVPGRRRGAIRQGVSGD